MWNLFKRKEDSVFEVIELMQTINNRKLKHLHDCIKGIVVTAKIEYTPPSSFITDYEQKVLDRFAGEKAERLKKLVNTFYDEQINPE